MNQTILLVEDNPSDEKLTLMAFRNCGVAHQIVVARDGAAALDSLHPASAEGDEAGLPAVVLLDLKLPKLDGLDVLRALREDPRTRFLPVVVLTASNEDEDVRRCYSLGANAYVRKPVEFVDFAKAAQAMGLFWLCLKEPAPFSRSAP